MNREQWQQKRRHAGAPRAATALAADAAGPAASVGGQVQAEPALDRSEGPIKTAVGSRRAAARPLRGG